MQLKHRVSCLLTRRKQELTHGGVTFLDQVAADQIRCKSARVWEASVLRPMLVPKSCRNCRVTMRPRPWRPSSKTCFCIAGASREKTADSRSLPADSLHLLSARGHPRNCSGSGGVARNCSGPSSVPTSACTHHALGERWTQGRSTEGTAVPAPAPRCNGSESPASRAAARRPPHRWASTRPAHSLSRP